MASIFSSSFGQTKHYEPSPRFGHGAAPVGGRCYLWGGRVQDFSESGRRKLASTVEIFDPYLETWEKHPTTGVPPPGLYYGACTSLLDSLYWYGGYDGKSDYNCLHRLDPTTLEWRELQPLNQAGGPMRKSGCGMVSFPQNKLAMFGGYGIPTGPTQPGATFTKDTNCTYGIGWSNELHVFNITEGRWSSPPTTGPRPPPSNHFSFTAINDHQAVLFGGLQPGHCRVSDCYLMDFKSMEWTELGRPEGVPWPVGRTRHAACCLNYGEEHPQLLVTGGVDSNENTLQDAWILDVKSGRWWELILPEGAQPQMFKTATALSLGPGRTQVTMFGGCPKWEVGKSIDAQQKLADTTVLEFADSVDTQGTAPTAKWNLVDVADSKKLGSAERVKMRKQQQEFAKKLENCVQQRVAAIEARAHQAKIAPIVSQNTIQELQAQKRVLEQRVQKGEQRNLDLQTQVEAVKHAFHESQQSLKTFQRSLQMTQADKQALEEALRVTQRRVATAEESAQEAREQVQVLQQRVQRMQEVERRAAEAERMAQKDQQRANEEPEKSEHSWLVHREEINLTEEELGRGGWGVVKVATFRGTHIAAKCLYGALNYGYWRNVFSREMNMAAKIRHPNLLQFIGATLEGELIILTELMPTSLRAVLERAREPLPHQQIATIGLDVARALNYLHLMRPTPLIHRDVSSANVLLEPQPNDRWKAKVSDYGSVNLLQNLRTVGPGSPVYAAPEANIPPLQSPKMDIFSFGVLLVEMCTACFPDVADRERLIRSIQQPDMVALIRQCLAEDKNARPSASDIITELSEPHDT